ncbi:alpha galactosidase [Treponema primitia ZAS-2]|uniref:Alpha galactosidase n=1 Tax=Treponema primitia (strain ATCC BAA-887 / DSM 12427 / ZAS-2) TaxID=545694 RepID=F5YKG8_TREPZ|nr:glycoside hydrolase family 36 protein [Treponema primitia]AEF85385.1 alpha galactosidase [Treponema primitia ZAS-2]
MELIQTKGPLPTGLAGTLLRYTAGAAGQIARERGGAFEIALWPFEELMNFAGLEGADQEAFGDPTQLTVQCGGWQSWSAGWELAAGETLPNRVLIIPELLKLTNRPGDTETLADRSGKDWLIGHFIMYIRAGDRYLCIAALDEGPPVTYRINMKRGLVSAEIYCPGKTWAEGEAAATLAVFSVQGFFSLKDALRKLYGQEESFKTTAFLGKIPGGYESWYNHYTNINEKLILGDLENLGKTENIIKLHYLDSKKPVVFQIDDGWEKAVGEWEINYKRFPQGLAPVASQIEQAGYIPGLWFAPFLVIKKARIFREKPEWVLREKPGGKPVVAGFNHLWDKQYYCLDISREDVLDYLGGLINRAVDEWGFRYLKLDFLYTGLFNGAFANPGSPHEHYRRACAVLTGRSATRTGLPVAYLGCGLPLGPSYRRFPLSRIGADTKAEWDWKLVKCLGHTGRPSAYINLMDTIGRSFMNGSVYINDPDVIFLRSQNCRLTANEKELIALVNFLLAGQIMFSDNPLQLSPDDLALSGHIAELYRSLEGDEYGVRRLDRDLFRLESRSRKTTGIINLSEKPWQVSGDETEGGFYAILKEGEYIIDHRIGGTMNFAPHTITILRIKK